MKCHKIDEENSKVHVPETMNRRLIPPLSALVAFEAAARHASFSRAADELALTPGAVSRQVGSLEAMLGVRLFDRVKRGVRSTPAGDFYAARVRETLTRLAAFSAEIAAFRRPSNVLNLGMTPAFGSRWLIPRMESFFARHRDVTVNFSTQYAPPDFTQGVLDAAIHLGHEPENGIEALKLVADETVPVAAPHLLEKLGVERPEDVRRATLLMLLNRPTAWTEWFAAHGLTLPAAQPQLTFEQFSMVVHAATTGLGIAIVPIVLITDELAKGQLVSLFETSVSGYRGYYLYYPTERRNHPALAAFRSWMLDEITAAEPAGAEAEASALHAMRPRTGAGIGAGAAAGLGPTLPAQIPARPRFQ